jgi:hypothetical protein
MASSLTSFSAGGLLASSPWTPSFLLVALTVLLWAPGHGLVSFLLPASLLEQRPFVVCLFAVLTP